MVAGDEVRNWEVRGTTFAIFPYDTKTIELLKFTKQSPEGRWFNLFRESLSNRPTFSGTFAEAGREIYEYHQLPVARAQNIRSIAFPEIATHGHFTFWNSFRLFSRESPLVKLPSKSPDDDQFVLTGLLNASAPLFWLKQICFNKGAGEDEHRDRFVYGGAKLERLPVPSSIAEKLRGKKNLLAEQLTKLSGSCSKRGQDFPSLALRKLFEKSGEAYHAWNAALPGHVPPHAQLPKPFTTTTELRNALTKACDLREKLRAEMIALQEEMDWLVYAAYGLLPENSPAVSSATDPAPLQEHERPFRFWAKADGDFTKAVALIPSGWPAARKKLWEARLTAIRDNEHIRRIEAPVYKRRWDEQWKVSNRWLAGPVAYAQELVDAFRWWLAEKAEWHLEHKANGGPLSLDAWSVALASNARVQAAWPVIAEAIHQVETWKIESNDKKSAKPPKVDASSAALVRFFRDTVNDETVPDGIPPAVPWEELEKKMKVPKQAKNVRGKLNVPRERFRLRETGYVWAGQLK